MGLSWRHRGSNVNNGTTTTVSCFTLTQMSDDAPCVWVQNAWPLFQLRREDTTVLCRNSWLLGNRSHHPLFVLTFRVLSCCCFWHSIVLSLSLCMVVLTGVASKRGASEAPSVIIVVSLLFGRWMVISPTIPYRIYVELVDGQTGTHETWFWKLCTDKEWQCQSTWWRWEPLKCPSNFMRNQGMPNVTHPKGSWVAMGLCFVLG